MATWSIRELKDKLSEAVRLAEAGETVIVTRNGLPVAAIVPPGAATVATSGATSGGPSGITLDPPPDDELGQLRWLQAVALESVRTATDERTRTMAGKEARALTAKLGELSGALLIADGSDLARYERMQPAELLEAIEAMAADLREAIRG